MDYLAGAIFLPARLRAECPRRPTDVHDAGPIEIDAATATADAVQSALTDRLGQVGFDADYDLTEEGAMLENLIDAFAGG
jgi:hypothetical protein